MKVIQGEGAVPLELFGVPPEKLNLNAKGPRQSLVLVGRQFDEHNLSCVDEW